MVLCRSVSVQLYGRILLRTTGKGPHIRIDEYEYSRTAVLGIQYYSCHTYSTEYSRTGTTAYSRTVRIFMRAGGWVGQLALLLDCMCEHKNLVGGRWSELPESQYKYS